MGMTLVQSFFNHIHGEMSDRVVHVQEQEVGTTIIMVEI